MAKKPQRRRRRNTNFNNYIRGRIDEQLSTATLAAKTLVSAAFDEVTRETCRVGSIVATWAMSDLTAGAGIGPLQVGVAHSDYTDTEIEEVIENTGSWDKGDKIAQERANRQIRTIGTFRAATTAVGDAVLNAGRPLRTRLNWLLTTGDTLRVWAYNQGSNPVATTVPIVTLQGHANLWLT